MSAMPTTGFARRVRVHDELAVPQVVARFAAAGFEAHACIGIEAQGEAVHRLLCSCEQDITARKMRYRPDQMFIMPGNRAVLCEVKAKPDNRQNVAIEADSFTATRLWDGGNRSCMFVFVETKTRTAKACWAGDIKAPAEIRVPRRHDFRATISRLRADYPASRLMPCDWSNGSSGTAFFLVPFNHAKLRDLDAFIADDLGGGPRRQLLLFETDEVLR